jgi:hypothetical protein
MMLLQQKGSVLSDKVRNESQQGKTEYFEQLGPSAAITVTSRYGDSPHIAPDWQRRAVYLQDKEWGRLLDSFDKVKLLVDPQSAYVQDAGMAMGRAKDDIIIAAATGTAQADTGSGNGTVSSVSLANANKVAVDYVASGNAANSGLTLAKLIQTKHILGKNEIPKGTQFYFVHRQQQLTDLLNNVTTQVGSADYNNVKALVAGEVNYFLGMTFVQTERLTQDGTTDQTYCFAYERDGILLSTGQDITSNIALRPDKKFMWYAYFAMSIGATRMEEKRVVQVLCDESP